MEELIIFTTYNSFEADQIIAAFHDANIPAYKREHGAGQFMNITMGVSRVAPIDIIIPSDAEEAAADILVNMGLIEENE